MSKSSKNKKNQIEKLETQIENAEKCLDVIDKINAEENQRLKEEEEKKEREKKRLKNVSKTAKKIKNDLIKQLEQQEKNGKHFEDMVDDYIYFFELKEDLKHDIEDNGLRIECKTGNGYTTEKDNKSVERIVNVNAQMLKILQDLELKSPEEGGKDGLL